MNQYDEQAVGLSSSAAKAFWFVGAMWDGDDQTERFLTEGIWQNGYEDKFSDLVREMKPGDGIALKSTFVRKKELPFENHGRPVSAMRIKAVGTVTSNRGDGLTVEVEWRVLNPSRDWYFYTYRTTVCRARIEEEEMARLLVAFAFDGSPQDYDKFLAHPYWKNRYAADVDPLSEMETEAAAAEEMEGARPSDPYGLDDIMSEGGFMSDSDLAAWLSQLKTKKNLILQGPPGTGKTWLAKRLARAFIGQRVPSADQLRSVQFHPSLSYEDFVRGYRPSAEGKLMLSDGILLQVIEAARAQPDLPHILVVEEINRGNPAQVFGEMLTLLENTKRRRAEAVELAYRRLPGEKVYVPENFYLIGTMNIADRSLALVDLALRRRFAFATLEPMFNERWKSWCVSKGIPSSVVDQIQSRLTAVNSMIAEDRSLGPQFRIGHSFLTPEVYVTNPETWFRQIVEAEIEPLLQEYWFENPEETRNAVKALVADF